MRFSEFLEKEPKSHVDPTEKSGSFRRAGRPEPAPARKPPESEDSGEATVLEMKAYQEKLTAKVKEYLATVKGWRATDVLGHEPVITGLAAELNAPFGGIKKAITELARQEQEERKPRPRI